MEHRSLKILLVLLGASAVFLSYTALTTKAQDTTSMNSCDPGTDNIYANQDLDVEEKMELYHKTINEKFNASIKRMIKAEPGNPDSLPPKNEEECSESNYSTFCIARDLLSNPSYGYMAYSKALNCSKYTLYEDTKEKGLWDKYIEAYNKGTLPEFMAGEEYQQAITSRELQTTLAARVLATSARLEGIDREIETSKRALDQTLATYNELRTAWAMHKKYMEIYNSLVKYRDKLAEIRHQAEQFPSEFIDATTTKCI